MIQKTTPTFAILGGTGSTGSEVISYLLTRDPPVNLNIYARSTEKLHSMHPSLKASSNVSLFIGSIDNTELLTSCLRDVSGILCAVASNNNDPGTSISQSTAHAVVKALAQLRSASESPSTYRAPPMLWPSSCSLNPVFAKRMPRALLFLALRGGSYVYNDLRLAAAYLDSQGDWMSVSYWQPGPIVDDIPRGYVLTLTEGSDNLSYADLARGMVQIVEEDGGRKWAGKEVGFVALGGQKVKPLPPSTAGVLLWGLASHYFPWLWQIGRNRNWW